ncbi:MAG TPA: hypothetical protein EYG69_01585 [Campylobacterales bacterium]|nr:hypothetical protein [Campylobacterales bacterium]
MKKVIIGVLFLGMALFAKCDFSEGAVNTVEDCPQLACIPDATIVTEDCCVAPAPVVVSCCTSVCSSCAPVVSTPSCIVIVD